MLNKLTFSEKIMQASKNNHYVYSIKKRDILNILNFYVRFRVKFLKTIHVF